MIWPFNRRTSDPAPQPPVDAQKAGLADPEPWLIEIFGGKVSPISVAPSNAMRCTPVRAAVQAIAEPIGQLPLHVYRRDGDKRERETEHPAARLIADPNEWSSAQDFREQLQRDCLLHGNGYAFINRVDGELREMTRLEPEAVQVEADDLSGEPRYKLMAGKRVERVLDRRDVFHVKAPSINGVAGESPVRQCQNAIKVALAMESHARRLFGRGARPSGALMFPRGMGEDAVKKTRAAWAATHEGENDSGKTAVLHDGADFKPFVITSVDAQFLELWQHAITEIARIYRVPPHMLFELGRATWGNAGEMGATFLTFSLMRWLKAWQGEIRLKLFTPEERGTLYAEFQTNDLLKPDLAARATAYSTLIAARVLNPNEARAMENRPPYEGGNEFLNPHITSEPKEPENGSD